MRAQKNLNTPPKEPNIGMKECTDYHNRNSTVDSSQNMHQQDEEVRDWKEDADILENIKEVSERGDLSPRHT